MQTTTATTRRKRRRTTTTTIVVDWVYTSSACFYSVRAYDNERVWLQGLACRASGTGDCLDRLGCIV